MSVIVKSLNDVFTRRWNGERWTEESLIDFISKVLFFILVSFLFLLRIFLDEEKKFGILSVFPAICDSLPSFIRCRSCSASKVNVKNLYDGLKEFF